MKKEHRYNIEATRFFLEQNEKRLSKTKVAELFGANRKAITKLEKTYMNYIDSQRETDKDYMFLFEEKELEVCQEFNNNANTSKISLCKKYGIGNTKTLDNWLEILGFSTQRHYKYNFNRRIFSNEPTEEMAYWLGFLLADGYVDKYTLNLRLAERDKEHVYKFAYFLGYSKEEAERTITQVTGGAYTKDNICYDISVNSIELVEDLKKYNIVSCKSMQEVPYIFNNLKLDLAYIRGIIDGDGWISDISINKNVRMGVVGSKEVCEYIKNFLSKYTSSYITEVKPKAEAKDGKILYYWQTTSEKATIDILKVLYPEDCSIYLNRKFKHAIAVYKSRN